MPSRNHSRVAQRIGVLLDRYSEKFDVHQQLSLQLGGWDSIPDIAVYPVGVLSMDLDTDEEEVSVPPLLAIEILSPKQNLQPLVEKVRRYLANGVKSCWIVLPMTHLIVVYKPEGYPESFSKGLLRDAATGIEINVDDCFPK